MLNRVGRLWSAAPRLYRSGVGGGGDSAQGRTKVSTSLLLFVLTLCYAPVLSACSRSDSTTRHDSTAALADQVWAYGQSHPDGFTLDLRTMTAPREGIAVSYAATQGSHSRSQAAGVVGHALQHDGYVGGWIDGQQGLYYFDSTRLFAEDSLGAAIRFGKENGQQAAFILSTHTNIPLYGKVAQIAERDTLLVGTTGDYRPLSFCEDDGTRWGFCLEVAQQIARRLGVAIAYVNTSWPTLTADVMGDEQGQTTFDLAIGGITITDTRKQTMLMSEGYLANGKTIICRADEASRFRSLADIDKPGVRVMVNPGGLNEKFANDSLKQATILVHQRNEQIPSLIAEGEADVMITEITEAPYYVSTDSRLAAPLLSQPFTHGQIGVLMRKGQEDLLQMVNNTIRQMKADGSLRALHEKYGLVYAYGGEPQQGQSQ